MFSIIIPTHNEENRIGETLEALFFYLEHHFRKGEYEIIIIDDGADRTALKVRELENGRGKVRLFHYPHRLGKGGALMEGFRRARGEYLVTYDADGAIPAREIPKMLWELKKYDLVIGSRKMRESDVYGKIPLKRKFASLSFNLLINLLFNLGIGDTQCGFKGLRREVARKLLPMLRLRGFEWDVELIAKAERHGFRIREVGVEWHHKKEGKVKVGDTAGMLRGMLKLKAEFLGIE